MKKKIISISIIGMFLLTGLLNFSVTVKADPPDLCEALDNCDLEWSASPTDTWYGQTSTYYHYGDDPDWETFIICVYKKGIEIKDAEVTATNITSGEEYELAYVEDDSFPGYWLHQDQLPFGEYHVQAKKGLRSGSITIEYTDNLAYDYIHLKFFESANVYYERPILSILRLLFSSLPIFR